ncbi:hypothetical protein EK21DRAFT_109687 [Setomelanomma holmii]|uniref:Uncharacterized protein n=1 Tax=Setomelanomma holmii TaxID=210430 RepID=A0A9P4HFG8_9PLEO|nr:hypothetical protein EK21DRAFT_109687 [Setomelanomma holmii]
MSHLQENSIGTDYPTASTDIPLLIHVTTYANEHFAKDFARVPIPSFITEFEILDASSEAMSRPFTTYGPMLGYLRQRDASNLHELFHECEIAFVEPFSFVCPSGPRTDQQYEKLEALLRYFFLVKGVEEPMDHWNLVSNSDYCKALRRACGKVRHGLEKSTREARGSWNQGIVQEDRGEGAHEFGLRAEELESRAAASRAKHIRELQSWRLPVQSHARFVRMVAADEADTPVVEGNDDSGIALDQDDPPHVARLADRNVSELSDFEHKSDEPYPLTEAFRDKLEIFDEMEHSEEPEEGTSPTVPKETPELASKATGDIR